MSQAATKKRLALFAAALLIAAIALEIYTRWPSSAVSNRLVLDEDTRYLVLILHGSGGREEPTLLAIADWINAEIGTEPGVAVRHYVWSPWSDARLRASAHGSKIGRSLGAELAELNSLRNVRLIAHSAGASLLNPLCEAYRALTANPAKIEMTYLDGMGIRGAWDYYYGYRHFGECGDFSSAIYSTDDPVPGTNDSLDYAYNLDVTTAPSRADYSGPGHIWPVQYFLDHLSREELTPGQRNHDERPRGDIKTVQAPPLPK
jgi:hypothetical protein